MSTLTTPKNCATCQHGTPYKDSTYGYVCNKWCAIECKPFFNDNPVNWEAKQND